MCCLVVFVSESCCLHSSGLNSEAVDWLEVFSVVQRNPGYYSDALMNMYVCHTPLASIIRM